MMPGCFEMCGENYDSHTLKHELMPLVHYSFHFSFKHIIYFIYLLNTYKILCAVSILKALII